MKTQIQRKQTAFRINETLLNDLKAQAQQCNRSLNNYVELLLAQAVYGTPNAETTEAINESRSGKFAGTLDISSFEAFQKSINEL